jgi:hypothetical protein
MNEPTKEQIKEFWEWCGFCYRYVPYGSLQARELPESTDMTDTDKLCLTDPNGWESEYPSFELNNLFKWAVPKLLKLGMHSVEFVYDSNGIKCFLSPLSNWVRAENPTLALFWAAWAVKEGL